MVDASCAVDGIHCVRSSRSGKVEAGTTVRYILHGVAKPARVADDRNGSLTHGIHLIQAAWFHTGWHEKEVGRSIDLMRKMLFVTKIQRKIGENTVQFP